MTRLALERAYHDDQAAQRRSDLNADRLRFADDAYLDHETWIRPAMNCLGDVREMSVLDLGCGHGMASIVLARRGARVTALELSSGYLHETLARADANGVVIDAVQADAENLPFADRSFDRIWGHAILHHLDVPRAAAEISRILKPGGRAVFCEPWGDNPVLRWARRRLPYPGKNHTPDESPLRSNCLPPLRRSFPKLDWHGYQLFGMVRRAYGDSLCTRLLTSLDCACLTAVPALQRWCRYVVLTLPREYA